MDDKKVIKVESRFKICNDIDSIKDYIAQAKAKRVDLSEVYIDDGKLISLNFLIVDKILRSYSEYSLHPKIEINNEVRAVLDQLDSSKEYIDGDEKKNLISLAYKDYYRESTKEVALEILKILLVNPVGEKRNYTAMVNGGVIMDNQSIPLLFAVVNRMTWGKEPDTALWNLYKEYINDMKEKGVSNEDIIGLLGLNTAKVVNDFAGGSEFNLLQYVAYIHRTSGSTKDEPILRDIAQYLIDLGMDPYQETTFQGKMKSFFDIKPGSEGKKAWTPEDFGLVSNKSTSTAMQKAILCASGIVGVGLYSVLHWNSVMSSIGFPAANIVTCLIGGVASGALVFVGSVIYNAATANEQNWKKTSGESLLSFVFTSTIIAGQELSHHFLPKLPEVTIAIYAVGALGIALINAFAIPAVSDKMIA